MIPISKLYPLIHAVLFSLFIGKISNQCSGYYRRNRNVTSRFLVNDFTISDEDT